MGLQLSPLTDSDSWQTRYTLHTFFASIALLGLTPESIEFVQAGESVNIDVVSESRNNGMVFRFNDRNITSEYVHRFSSTCEIYTECQAVQGLACDCIVKHLISLLVSELEPQENVLSRRLLQENELLLLSQMPRHLEVKSQMYDGKPTTLLSWDVCEPDKCLRGFKVAIFHGHMPSREMLYHDQSLETDAMIVSVQGQDKFIRLDLIPGTEHTVIARSNRPKSIYSCPFTFTAPLISPWNIEYKIKGEKIEVCWEYCNPSTFLVTLYTSNVPITAVVVGELMHCFDIKDISISELGVRAVNNGVESDEVRRCIDSTHQLLEGARTPNHSVILAFSVLNDSHLMRFHIIFHNSTEIKKAKTIYIRMEMTLIVRETNLSHPTRLKMTIPILRRLKVIWIAN